MVNIGHARTRSKACETGAAVRKRKLIANEANIKEIANAASRTTQNIASKRYGSVHTCQTIFPA